MKTIITDKEGKISDLGLAKKIVDLLNDCFAKDPNALYLLQANRVACNKSLAEHPTVQVSLSPINEESYTLGIIGLLNGLLSKPLIVSVWDEKLDSNTLIGFDINTNF